MVTVYLERERTQRASYPNREFLSVCKSNDRIANGDLLLCYSRLRFAKVVFYSSGCMPNDFLAVSCMKFVHCFLRTDAKYPTLLCLNVFHVHT